MNAAQFYERIMTQLLTPYTEAVMPTLSFHKPAHRHSCVVNICNVIEHNLGLLIWLDSRGTMDE